MKRYIGLTLLLAGAALAQPPQPRPVQEMDGPQQPPPPPAYAPPPPIRATRPPMERSLMPGPPGRWWNNPQMVQKLALNSDQQKKMDDIFQMNRLKLIDLNATLQKEEVTLEPLLGADQPDESKILAQIDKVAQARAELEKANARFLLGIRRVLTPDQWKKLQAENPPGGGRGPGGPQPAGVPRPARR
ncbi:MAG: periplasmic heavy metal sensor [Candidatus Sulfopaludibacter sp.]|nr:periplasmic heavy metal sensor [Candidatus Sulfopaludibacter sp.]